MPAIYAMDTFFYTSLGSYDLTARCQMLSELGYDGTYLTVWSPQAEHDIHQLATIPANHKLAVHGVYFMLNIADPVAMEHTLALIAQVPVATTIELAVYVGQPNQHQQDAQFDDLLLSYLPQLCHIAEQHNHQLALYPHVQFWLETTADAVRICTKYPHPRLGIAFTAFHWYASGQRDLVPTMQTVAPWLKAVNMCGTRVLPPGHALPASIELIDSGELDVFVVLCHLKNIGYNGPIGLQGYGIGGDVYRNLRTSIQTFRDLNNRAALRSHWANLRPRDA